ncbi:hypothetical protein Amsp01_004210 [Amycolatopsis sp. NBRC 101858]|uniref:hypothetical protein n=1 Tax=Amycolatopsis sp. NBRC 101858 TaxID=3032200 RepID=UPI0024A45B43|nr:hypothetical protein [Amycolatopsis sp. NBRC 101858]GLY34397.1 hypothetical protein Amsp01_004210 [Amycolatopsis sp. NBRC 101858]
MKKMLTGAVVGALVAVSTAGTAEAAPAFVPPTAAGCGGTGYAPPGGAWGAVSNSSCGLAGSPGLKIRYTYTSRSDASPIHASAKHYTTAEGSNPGAEQWTEFGAGTRGDSGLLPWGNSLAMKSIKFQSINVLGAIVDWS